MKRKSKSILMTIVALLFASVAIGQRGTWPDVSALKSNNYAGSDTVYFCEHRDSLYPIELGYDGLGLSLLPSYGKWSLIATSNNNAAADYDFNIPNGNGGAGNAFKTVGTRYGGYLFQYLATDAQCNLPVGDKFYVFVFVLPDKSVLQDKGDTLVCLNAGTNNVFTFDFNNSFGEYIDLYKKAGVITTTPVWKAGNKDGKHSIATDKVETFPLQDTLVLSSTSVKEYSCGSEIVFKITAKVVTEIPDLEGINVTTCASDTVAHENSNPNIFFKRNNVAGTYNPSTIKDAASVYIKDGSNNVILVKRKYTFTPTLCNGSSGTPVNDSLFFLPDKGDNLAEDWGRDTISACRTKIADGNIFAFYDKAQYPPRGKFDLNVTNSVWYDRGLTGVDGYITGHFGTISGGPSLHKGSFTVLIDSLKSSYGYNYLWKPTGIECLEDKNGDVDSGLIVIIIHDAFIAQDYTAQLCETSYSTSKKFYLNQYTGLPGVQWSGLGITGKDTLVVATAGIGTHKYTYSVAPDCGPGGTGVFYIKIGLSVKTPKSKTVRYCLNKLPGQINLNDVLNVAVDDIAWTITSKTSGVNLDNNDGAFSTNGILNIGEFGKKNPSMINSPITLVFTTTSGSCVGTSTQLTLEFVNDITAGY